MHTHTHIDAHTHAHMCLHIRDEEWGKRNLLRLVGTIVIYITTHLTPDTSCVTSSNDGICCNGYM